MPSLVTGATVVVPTEQPTIQEGINAASIGDTVLVLPGVYVENLMIGTTDLVVRSAEGPAVTVIDGSSPPDPDHGSAVTISAGSIEGFDIRNGSGRRLDILRWGGGVSVESVQSPGPLVTGNWIHDNQLVGAVTAYGAGVYVQSAGMINQNRIYSNVISGGTRGWGVGIYNGTAIGAPSAVIEENEIYDNTMACVEGRGAGINVSRAEVTRNIVACNRSYELSPGIQKSGGTLESNTVVANWSDLLHAAVRVGGAEGETSVILGNNIANNIGPGLECHQRTTPPFVTFVVECNNVVGNGPGDQIIGDCSGAIGQDGNISVDPLFGQSGCEPGQNNWCLGASSPLLLDPPPGCGLIGALGLCPPIGIHDVRPPSPPRLQVRAPRPNPFLERTTIPFYLPRSGQVSVGIYDVMGRRVRALEPGWHTAGDHALEWDGRDDTGRRVPSGAYVARIRAGGEELTRTLLLIR
jgi:hypothetical protein